MSGKRAREIDRELTGLSPMMPFADAEVVRNLARRPSMRSLPPSTCVWLATVTHIRHNHTEYDQLLDDGYGRDAARFFVLDDINEVLTLWQSKRFLEANEIAEVPDRGFY